MNETGTGQQSPIPLKAIWWWVFWALWRRELGNSCSCILSDCSQYSGREYKSKRGQPASMNEHFFLDGVKLCLCGTGLLTGALAISKMIQEQLWIKARMTLRGKNRTLWKTGCIATSTTNLIWTDLGMNPVFWGKKWRNHSISVYSMGW
jgi:hypothetical protein